MPLITVVLDTNVLVSGIAYPASTPGTVVGAWRAGRLELVTSHYVLDEVARVLPRLRHASVNEAMAKDLASSFLFLARVVVPADVNEPDLRDPADAPVLGTLVASGADWLITGDHDLLALAGRYPILTPAAFWERFGG
ncbi:MAG: putative toxin-antitoxin system toxin component, PIN family [Propionibacteriaceae bacterium]|jgi:putative PIN family toxin of toxin-antitoxin system|nr:putative toxin-antitoxin system toxin component, PIN family [Propionibacteriaceae bacterium]